MRICHVLVLNSYPDPPFQNPVSAPEQMGQVAKFLTQVTNVCD